MLSSLVQHEMRSKTKHIRTTCNIFIMLFFLNYPKVMLLLYTWMPVQRYTLDTSLLL